MADFLDSEAEESDDEEEMEPHEKKKLKKLKAMESDDDEDEDDDEKLREELKDLIDDNPIEEDESGEDSDASGGSKKRKKSDDEDFDDRLEDEDYDLLEENLGRKIERKKRFKRLKRIEDDDSGNEEQEGDEGEDREAIANQLFEGGSDHEMEERDDDHESERIHRSEADLDMEGEEEESDADDFIVDDDGRPIADKRKKRKPIFSDAALQEAQDIFGVDFDYDEFDKYGDEDYDEEDDEEDEYVDEDEDIERRRKPKKAAKKKPTRKSIFEIYEPSELKRGHFTDLDNEIRNTDVPERMQLREFPVTPTAEGSDELDKEAEWIYKQAFCKTTISSQDGPPEQRDRQRRGPQMVGKIKKALDFMRNHFFEVPFIAFYRKEYVQPELTINDLWRVYKFDAKWCLLRSRKMTLISLFEKMRDYQAEQLTKDINADLPEGIRLIRDEDIDRLRAVQTTEELKDVHSHFLLHYGHEVPAMQEAVRAKERAAEAEARRREAGGEEGDEVEVVEPPPPPPSDTIKQAVRSGPYAMCRKAKIDGFAKRFGLTPEQFGENLRDNYQRHEVEQEAVSPLELAQEYVSGKFTTPEDALRAAKYMVAMQIARDPLVRNCVRETFFERAKLDIAPTKKGLKEIDENHPCYSMKYVKGKPVRDLTADMFLKLSIAQSDRLITMSINDQIEGITSSSYLEEAKQLYYRDEFSKNVQEWNLLRMESVEMALKKMVLPDLKKELRAHLLEEAKEAVMKACCRKLYNWIKVAPLSVDFGDEDDDDWDASKGLRVMAIAYVPDYSQAAFACLIAPDGECTDHLRLPNLLKRKNSFREDEKLLKEADLLALRNFISTKRPHAVVIGGESRDAMMVSADVKEIIGTLVEDEQFPQLPVEIMDNEFAKVYANSIKGENDFRDYPMLLRQAISLARRIQDPLVEFSQLCTSDEEILCLRYHPLQDHLVREELLEALNLEFVNRTNEVGVDINQVVANVYSGNLVQFVCGLGPRKGAALIKLMKQTNQRLENRTQLVTTCHMGPKVFINCAGFIKIDTNSLGDSTESYVEVLDGSRVHPETYEWARKMAVDALEYDDEDANPAGALEEILEAPERLKDLDLDAFAEELERQGFGNKSITLYDIRAELNHRYKDLRQPYQSPNAMELFNMLTHECPETFYIGKMVQATVTGISHKKPDGEQLDQANPVRKEDTGLWQCPFCLKNDFPELSEVWNHFDAGGCPGQATGVRIRLDNGITGYIHIKNLSDKHVTDPEERVSRGQMIHCRITKIDVDRFAIDATSKSSDLLDKKHEWRPTKDPYYDHEAEAKDIKVEEEAKKVKQRQTYIKRVIVHPAFHNISYAEAEKIMVNMEQGECIIRPSSKGADHLTVTWKVADGIYQHIDVREEGKENAFSLGTSLWIGNEEFEDLDEIIARYVNPMAAHARDLFAFRYYKDTEGGLKDKAEEFLKEEKKKNPQKIHYIVSVSKNYPGKFLLSYLPRNKCKHELITVTPEGFRFRGQTFDTIGMCFKWFKEHFRDPIPGTPSTPRSGIMTGRATTPHNPYTPNVNISMNSEALHRVAQNMNPHMLHNLAQVASQTPHYPTTPGGYTMPTYPNTPYTPTAQTPFMTPYHATTTPRYGGQTPSAAAPIFVHPGTITPGGGRTPSQHTPTPTPPQQQFARSVSGRLSPLARPYSPSSPYSPTQSFTSCSPPSSFHPSLVPSPQHSTASFQLPLRTSRLLSLLGTNMPTDPMDWRKAAEEWAKLKNRENTNTTPRQGSSTPSRYEDRRMTPRNNLRSPRQPQYKPSPRQGYEQSPRNFDSLKSPRLPPGTGPYDPYGLGSTKSPRYVPSPRSGRSTPRTINSPRSMIESSLGDATPLYDENEN
ncbi:transcription elongation factor SPT6-like isoform X1 [Macrosteles quadrilineatus]|uniref:transcription elongation factor SPT6-like isoform X1 n=1 Tax=Macrosteles quadrilineatus TaxID=74068 RepID=UPI0023E1BA36|nr:transcription elongation factor SPT6-like isoform X1 [Macrosteles quadrilineatus]